jgi:hypothetical protein
MTDADRTLTNGDGSAANEARYAFINMTGTLTAARNVIVPTASKLFFFKNATTGGFAITLKTSAGTGISVPNGKAMVLMCDGTNVIDAVTSFSSLSLATALPVTSGGTGVTTSTGTTNVVLSNSPTLVTPALGTPSALVGTNITGTAANLTAGNVTTNANLTGPITSVGNATTIVGPIPAVTLSGTMSGGGNQINNVIIGTVTPLAGSFTTLTASGNVGIGTASPGEALVVTSSTATTLLVEINNTKAAGQGDAYLKIAKAANGNSNGIQLYTGGTQKWVIGTGITAVDDNFKIYNPAIGASLSIAQSTGVVSTLLDATINGVTVGKGAGSGVQNTAIGASALAANTGDANTALGSSALVLNTSGADNTALGARALFVNTTGGQNTAVGRLALAANTTASSNTGIGYQAGYSNTTGTEVAALGFQAMYSQTTGARNSALGYQALYTNATGTDNTAVGRLALTANTASSGTAVGSGALYANTTGASNSAFGSGALQSNTTGASNVAVGASALVANTTASTNTALGYQAGYTNTTGNNNVYVGSGAGQLGITSSANVAVGKSALAANTGDNHVAVGYAALNANTSGASNTALGQFALYANTTASNNTAVGNQALYSNTTADNNTAVGYQAGFSGTTGAKNTFLGYQAGYDLTTGIQNTFIGSASAYGAGSAVTTGSKNVIIGGYTGAAAPISATGSNFVVLSDGDGNVRGYYDSNGNLIVPVAAKGINFTANTAAAGMTSQLLNWYEEGTFTPVLAFSTSGSVTYSNQEGRYTRVGRQVTINIWIRGASISSPLGNVTLSGLPFTSSATAARVAVAIFPGLMTIVGTAYAVNYPSSNTLTLLVNNNGSGSDLQGTSLTNANFEIYCSMSYFV